MPDSIVEVLDGSMLLVPGADVTWTRVDIHADTGGQGYVSALTRS